MSYLHNELAYEAGEWILADLRSGNSAWSKGLFHTQTAQWPGIIEWPVPDRMFDDGHGSSLAVEFKPPGHGKREYVTGLGQTLTYLQTFKFATLVIPERAADGFPIAAYLAEVLRADHGDSLPIALLSYSESASILSTVVELRDRRGAIPSLPHVRRRAFWAYTRDASHFDVFDMLAIMEQRDLLFNPAYVAFWNEKRCNGTAKTLEGEPRKPKDHPFSEALNGDRAERTNLNLFMRHMRLIDRDGRITETGYQLLRRGKVYSTTSESFRQLFTSALLTFGKHLELILWIEQFQRTLSPKKLTDHISFKHRLDAGLEAAGHIRAAPLNMAKETFIRDESKLWNQLGLLDLSGGDYFRRGYGYCFNWRAITAIASVDW